MASSLQKILKQEAQDSNNVYRFESFSYSSLLEIEAYLDVLAPETLMETMLIFDLAGSPTEPWAINRFQHNTGETAYIALAYPEVYTVVYDPPDHPVEDHFENNQYLAGQVQQLLEAIRVHSSGFRTWFDATQIRSKLRHRIWKDRSAPSVYHNLNHSRQNYVAAVSEDERSFLLLEAYAAYRLGHAVWLLSNEQEFWERLPVAGKAAPSTPQHLQLLITDWELTYPDHKGSDNCELVLNVDLSKIDSVLVVTSSLKREQLALRMHEKRNVSFLEKPIAGIHSLLEVESTQILLNRSERAYAREIPNPVATIKSEISAHDAPYVCVRIAHKLMQRARKLQKDGIESVENAVHVALLSGEAKELLGGLSRTLSYEALSVQNSSETKAEALFFGTSQTQGDVCKRVALLEKEVHHIGGSEVSDSLSGSERNCVLRTVQVIRKIYSDFEHYGAAEECLRQFSKHERGSGPMKLFYCYCDFVTDAGSSAGRLLIANILIIAVFGAYFGALLDYSFPQQPLLLQAAQAVAHSAFSFVQVGLGPPGWDNFRLKVSPNIDAWAILIPEFIELCLAYLHLGLFISLLYRKLTRRSP